MKNYISPERNILIPLEKSRSEFIEKFNEKNRTITRQSTSSSSNQNERWNLLYNQGKVQKLKEETFRKQELEKRTKTEESECTFSPKLISKYKSKSKPKLYDNDNDNQINNLLNRQQNWLLQRDLHLEGFKEEMNNKDSEECHFKPKIVKKYIFLYNFFNFIIESS